MALVKVPLYFINLLPTSLLYISTLLPAALDVRQCSCAGAFRGRRDVLPAELEFLFGEHVSHFRRAETQNLTIYEVKKKSTKKSLSLKRRFVLNFFRSLYMGKFSKNILLTRLDPFLEQRPVLTSPEKCNGLSLSPPCPYPEPS